jgi:hypothetical protein
MTTEVIVHHLTQAKAVLHVSRALGVEVRLRSAPGAAAFAGAGYLKALGDAVGQALLIDCDDDPGIAMAALRSGSKHLLLSGPSDHLQRVGQMALRSGAQIKRPDNVSSLTVVLSPDDDESDIRSELARLAGA